MAVLLEQREGGASVPIPLNGNILRIGRSPENDLQVADGLVSRRHAEIRQEGGQWVAYDLDSMNGTFVNGERISKQVLRPGDTIMVGPSTFHFDDGNGVHPQGPSPGPLPPGAGTSGDLVKSIRELEQKFSLDRRLIRGGDVERPSADPSRQFYILYQIGKVINASNGIDDLLRTALQLTFEAIDAERGGVFLLDKEGTPELRASHFRNRDHKGDLKVSRTLLSKVINERVGMLTSDARYDPRFEEAQSIAAFNIRSALCVPIWERQNVVGAIYLDNLLETYAFSESDMDLLSAIANQLAIGVQNARLTEELKLEAVRRSNLEMYHSPDVVEMLVKQSRENERSALGVRESEVTVLFSDICGFTSMSTRFRASEIAFILNGYFDAMTNVVFRHKGSINKFIGDAVMAIYGAPVQHQNDAALAVQSAIDMIGALRDYLKNLDESKHFRIRIGINTGDVVVGNIGSSRRLEYTVLGDAVNTAQRLESSAPPNGILIGERTRALIGDLFKVRDVGLLKLKGKEPTRAYEVLF